MLNHPKKDGSTMPTPSAPPREPEAKSQAPLMLNSQSHPSVYLQIIYSFQHICFGKHEYLNVLKELLNTYEKLSADEKNRCKQEKVIPLVFPEEKLFLATKFFGNGALATVNAKASLTVSVLDNKLIDIIQSFLNPNELRLFIEILLAYCSSDEKAYKTFYTYILHLVYYLKAQGFFVLDNNYLQYFIAANTRSTFLNFDVMKGWWDLIEEIERATSDPSIKTICWDCYIELAKNIRNLGNFIHNLTEMKEDSCNGMAIKIVQKFKQVTQDEGLYVKVQNAMRPIIAESLIQRTARVLGFVRNELIYMRYSLELSRNIGDLIQVAYVPDHVDAATKNMEKLRQAFFRFISQTVIFGKQPSNKDLTDFIEFFNYRPLNNTDSKTLLPTTNSKMLRASAPSRSQSASDVATGEFPVAAAMVERGMVDGAEAKAADIMKVVSVATYTASNTQAASAPPLPLLVQSASARKFCGKAAAMPTVVIAHGASAKAAAGAGANKAVVNVTYTDIADTIQKIKQLKPEFKLEDLGEEYGDFYCEISKERYAMLDPVLLGDTGQTYDRQSIENWLQNSNLDPNTGAELKSTKLVPNFMMRKLFLAKLNDFYNKTVAAIQGLKDKNAEQERRPAEPVASPAAAEASVVSAASVEALIKMGSPLVAAAAAKLDAQSASAISVAAKQAVPEKTPATVRTKQLVVM